MVVNDVCAYSVYVACQACVCVYARALGMWHVSGMCVRVLCVAHRESWKANEGVPIGGKKLVTGK